ncbi:MAG: type II toxin-antitoxin system RelB/DinJ family antitoxin [Desulfovibrio sp.]|jgi:DNA-damage-inducible protein J|nr:type II toxin-antitoxin system RelB/DinJ family antitoxin [Desulfovibrio sp.]
MANVQVKVDDHLRDTAQAVAASMGLDLASAVRIFLTQMVRENGLPFKPAGDPFYSERNMAALDKSIAQLNAGQTVAKTLDELESMAK